MPLNVKLDLIQASAAYALRLADCPTPSPRNSASSNLVGIDRNMAWCAGLITLKMLPLHVSALLHTCSRLYFKIFSILHHFHSVLFCFLLILLRIQLEGLRRGAPTHGHLRLQWRRGASSPRGTALPNLRGHRRQRLRHHLLPGVAARHGRALRQAAKEIRK